MSPRRGTRLKLRRNVVLLALLCGPAQLLSAQRPVPVDRTGGYGPVAVVTARLDSLEQAARTAMGQPGRLEAVVRMLQIGRAVTEVSPPQARYPGVVQRLRRLYPALDARTRGVVVQGLSTLAERSETLAWLLVLAKSSEMGDGHIPIAAEAVEALARMGSAGEEALRQLHLSGEADPALQKMLDVLARTAYRRPPAGEAIPRRPPPLS